MSRELEAALREFIQDTTSGEFAAEEHEHDVDHDHEYRYADTDHTHEDDSNFEDKVYQYLGSNFSVGHGCRVQTAFEDAVRMVVSDMLGGNDVSEEAARTRHLLREILSLARALPPGRANPLLTYCRDALFSISGTEPELTTQAEPERITP